MSNEQTSYAYKVPDLSHMTSDDLCALILATGASNDPTDRAFAKGCAVELAKRKPATPQGKIS